jgi:transcriptional regulator with XRE-family HTH domain
MSKTFTTRTEPRKNDEVDLSNKMIRKQEFGRRLYDQLLKQRLNQSDLARKSGLGRDSISQYVRGRSVPTPQNLEKMAEALGIEPDDLFPNYAAQAIAIEDPTFQLRAVDGDSSQMWLTINQRVSTATAMAVMAALNTTDE